jgi:hypothetical protein
MGGRVRQGVNLELKTDLDDIKGGDAESGDETSYPTGENDLSAGALILEVFSPGRHACDEEGNERNRWMSG